MTGTCRTVIELPAAARCQTSYTFKASTIFRGVAAPPRLMASMNCKHIERVAVRFNLHPPQPSSVSAMGITGARWRRAGFINQ